LTCYAKEEKDYFMSRIEEIHNHLRAGNEVILPTAYCTTIFDKRHISYIRADQDGKGFRLGWPGKKSVYAFANQLQLVPAGMTMKKARRCSSSVN
jgi:hypothetical protein